MTQTNTPRAAMEIPELPVCPPPGLRNLGNTCYLNAMIQVLLRGVYGTTTMPVDQSSNVDAAVGAAFVTLYRVVKKLKHRENVCITPSALVQSVQRNGSIPSLRRRGRQQDAHELLLLLLDSCAGLHSMTEFSFASLLWSQDTTQPSRTDWMSHHLSVQLSTSIRAAVEDALEKDEGLDGGCMKRTCLLTLPPLLIIHLRRWHPTTRRKLSTPVHIDGLLRLSTYEETDVVEMTCPLQPRIPANQTWEYDLVGVVYHLGPSARCGHYVAAVRSRTRESLWYNCDDQRVSPCESPIDCSSNTAYICAYRLRRV